MQKAMNYNVGDFGHARFTAEKKCFKTGIDCWGTIRMIEKKYLLFVDNDNFEYIISKNEFQFEKDEKAEVR